jgi:hypothetical protein
MLLGSAGTVAVISTLILGFGNHAGGGQRWWRILELVLGLMALVAVSRNRWVDRRLTIAIRRVLSRFTDIDHRDRASLLDLAGDYAVSELSVSEGEWLAGHALGELRLRHEGAVVLGLTRADGQYVAVPTADTVIEPGDVLVVYGRGDLLCELDHRRAGEEGDRAHELAVAEQRRLSGNHAPL